MTCSSNIRQIAIALRQYESTYECLPPAYTVDKSGNPLHSWRALILPYIERSDLYQRIDFSKPWNDPVNKAVGKEVVDVYHCPGNQSSTTSTAYVAIVSTEGCLQPKIGRALSEITDPHSETLLLYECDIEQAIHWMEPRDIHPSSLLQPRSKPRTVHHGGRMQLFWMVPSDFCVTIWRRRRSAA